MEKELPKGWVETEIGIVSDLIRGVSYGKNDVQESQGDNDFLILRGGNIQDGKIITDSTDTVFVNESLIKESQFIRKGDVVIVGSTGSKNLIGKAGIAKYDFSNISFGAFMMLIRPNSKLHSSYFDYYFLSDNYRNVIRDLAGGVNINNIRKEYITGLKLPLPPLPEQKRIVAKLDSLFAHIENTKTRLEKVPTLLKNFRQAVLTQAVTGKLTEDQKRWDKHLLEELCISITDGDHQAPPQVQEGIPFLVISNVSSGVFDFDKVTRHVPKEYYDSLKDTRRPRKGDVLYTVTGSYGIPLIVDFDKEFCFQRHIAILRPDQNKILSKYLKFLLQSDSILKQAHNVATGTAQLTVPLRGIRSFEVIIPKIDVQTEIVRRVESLFAKADAIETKYKLLKEKIDNLPQTILSKSFKGELVEQLEGDGDARELLEEIKKMKLNQKKKEKR